MVRSLAPATQSWVERMVHSGLWSVHYFSGFFCEEATRLHTGAVTTPLCRSQCYRSAFAQAFPDSLNLLLLDNSGAHTAHQLTIPENVRLVYLPPFGPELNPIERV